MKYIYNLNFNLNTFMKQLGQKKKYLQELKNKIRIIQLIQKKKHQILYNFFFPNKIKTVKSYKKDDPYPLFISFIISIIYSKTNTFVHLMDFAGNMKLFYSAGDAGYWGKEKTQRGLVIRSIFKTFLNELTTLTLNAPVALHLIDVKHQISIIRHLKKFFFIRSVRFFFKMPHNGCRQPKVRRVKIRTKKFK